MPFDQAAKQKIQAWLNGKGSKLICAGCGQRKWQCDDPAGTLQLPYPTPPQQNLGGTLSFNKLVPLWCQDCGYTAFVNFAAMGLT